MKVLGVDPNARVKRKDTTPLTAIGDVIYQVIGFFRSIGEEDPGGYAKAIVEQYFRAGRQNGDAFSAHDGPLPSPEQADARLRDAIAKTSVSAAHGTACAWQALAYAADTIHAYKDGEIATAWALAFEANASACGARAAKLGVIYAEGLALHRAKNGGLARSARDSRTTGMGAIRAEWERWQRREITYRSYAEFGRKMHVRHPEFISDRSIAQRAAQWGKEVRNTSS